MRTQLLSAIKTAVAPFKQFGVSDELAWSQNDTPLYLKNLKKVYVDRERQEQTTLIATLDGNDVFQDDLICEVFLAVDAKTTPSQLDSVITAILGSKNSIGIVNIGLESDYTVDKQEDVLIYTFEFRINQATT
jgi:hypothetical protein